MFDEKTKSELKFYVYLLINPETKTPFYVGKGQGNRVFDHLNDAKDGRFVIVIGHDSKTQNIEKYIMDNVREYSRVSITKFGKDELLIKINSNT